MGVFGKKKWSSSVQYRTWVSSPRSTSIAASVHVSKHKDIHYPNCKFKQVIVNHFAITVLPDMFPNWKDGQLFVIPIKVVKSSKMVYVIKFVLKTFKLLMFIWGKNWNGIMILLLHMKFFLWNQIASVQSSKSFLYLYYSVLFWFCKNHQMIVCIYMNIMYSVNYLFKQYLIENCTSPKKMSKIP